MKTQEINEFFIDGEPVIIKFEPISMEGFYTVSIIGKTPDDFATIPLLLQQCDIDSSLLKLKKMKKNQISFSVFCKAVAGAILLSMKYKRD